jgi:hypothetical protein
MHVIGLDKPQRIEGIPWKGGGIDEFADIKEGAWEGTFCRRSTPSARSILTIAPGAGCSECRRV